VVIGGIGGSGTRMIAQIVAASGYFLGADLNEAYDNLWFTLLFKRPDVLALSAAEFHRRLAILFKAMVGVAEVTNDDREIVLELASAGSEQHDPDWLRQRAASLMARAESGSPVGPWGWKEPNSHIVLRPLSEACGKLKFIFVSRHGLDMALSSNQNQARFWGPLLLGKGFEATPRYSLRYWCEAHRRAIAAAGAIGDRFLFLRYDALCRDKHRELNRLLDFLGVGGRAAVARASDIIAPPPSIGRSRLVSLAEFDADDLDYVESLGFAVENR
jgi:hypothetical protein